MNADNPARARSVPPDELWHRLYFRGCRFVAATTHHRLVAAGDRRAIIPRYGERLPVSIVARIIEDLQADPWGPTR